MKKLPLLVHIDGPVPHWAPLPNRPRGFHVAHTMVGGLGKSYTGAGLGGVRCMSHERRWGIGVGQGWGHATQGDVQQNELENSQVG